ncbi:hypothetical protein TNCV_5120341 [Trichonephila clavipes]|nr:hypothetical protein TNCV_5120341 [Trichonephila clavipes]
MKRPIKKSKTIYLCKANGYRQLFGSFSRVCNRIVQFTLHRSNQGKALVGHLAESGWPTAFFAKEHTKSRSQSSDLPDLSSRCHTAFRKPLPLITSPIAEEAAPFSDLRRSSQSPQERLFKPPGWASITPPMISNWRGHVSAPGTLFLGPNHH